MAVDLQYIGSDGKEYVLYLNSEGFWESIENVYPSQYQNNFTASDISNTNLLFEQSSLGGWFQIDEVYLATSLVGDTYTIDVQEYDDALSGNPQLYHETSQFPNPLADVLVPVNEYMSHTAFNSVLGKLQENYEFLLDKGRYLSVPPNYISFRYGPSNYPEYAASGDVWQQLDNGLSEYWEYDNSLSADNVAGTSTAMIFSTSGVNGDQLIAVPVDGGVVPAQYDRDYYIFGDDTFDSIIALETDENEYIWALDNRSGASGRIGIFNFENNIWKYVSSWYSSVSTNSKYFQNPTDLKIKDERVYVSCDRMSGGVECRIHDLGGSYVGSAYHEDLTSIESMAITDSYIIALFNNAFYKFDIDTFDFVEKVDLTDQIFSYDYITHGYTSSTVTRLANNSNGIFFYGISGNLIYKFGESGSSLESFGETVVNHMNSSLGATVTSYIKPVSDVYHDTNFNLYASSVQDVVKYFDRVQIYNRLLDDVSFNVDDYIRQLSENSVDKDENTTAWVYNKIFDRILDNLTLYRVALKGSLALISTKTFEKVVVNNFTPSQFAELPYNKGDISVGINELHCEGALNRCIRQLHECYQTCLDLLNIRATGLDPDSLVIDSFTLESQVAPSPLAQFIDGVYYFDELRPVTSFEFAWDDGIVYRSDPKLRAYLSVDAGTEISLPILPTPNYYTDSASSFTSGSHTWTLRETYGPIERTEDLTVDWNTRIYYGTYPDGGAITDTDVLTATGSIIRPTFDNEIDVDVSNGKRFFIAIPSTEYNPALSAEARDVKLYHPDYSEMLYDFLPLSGTLVPINNFDNGYGDIGTYQVITPNEYGSIYESGITEIKFRLTRGI